MEFFICGNSLWRFYFKGEGFDVEKFVKSKVQPLSNISKNAVFMTEQKAQRIILSYVISPDNKGRFTQKFSNFFKLSKMEISFKN